jgi:hypothetical protein
VVVLYWPSRSSYTQPDVHLFVYVAEGRAPTVWVNSPAAPGQFSPSHAQFWCLTPISANQHVTSSLLMQVSLESNIFKNQGPGKNLISLGVTASCECPSGDLIIGGGDGTLGVIVANPGSSKANPKALKPMIMLASTKVQGGITSITVDEAGSKSCTFFVGTAACNMYKVTYDPAAAKYVTHTNLLRWASLYQPVELAHLGWLHQYRHSDAV